MKKTGIAIILLSLILSLCFFGCEKTEKPENDSGGVDPATLIGPFSIFDGGMTFYIDLREDRVTIYEDGTFDSAFQNFYHAGVSDLEISKAGFVFEDFNFDGFCDFIFPQRTVDGIQYYYGYLWDEEDKSFSLNIDFLNIGNPILGDGCVLGTELHEGEERIIEYYYENGAFTREHIEEDPHIEVALTYVKGFLGNDALTAEFTAWELIDNAICRKYFVYDGETVTAAVAVNADDSRVFYSPVTESYFEIIYDGESYTQSAESYGKMQYTGENFTYVAAAFESLSAEEKELYGVVYDDITAFRAAEYTDASAVKVIEAVLADHPVIRNYFRYSEKNGVVSGTFYTKWAPYKEADPDELKAAIEEYERFTDEIINSMPTGLEPKEKYLFLAQMLHVMTKETIDNEPKFELLISGDSRGEQLARTFKHLCEKAQVYCTCDGDKNTMLIGGEYVTVDIEDAFNHVPGNEKWISAFFDED